MNVSGPILYPAASELNISKLLKSLAAASERMEEGSPGRQYDLARIMNERLFDVRQAPPGTGSFRPIVLKKSDVGRTGGSAASATKVSCLKAVSPARPSDIF